MSAPSVSAPSCAIVVLNWNGIAHLEALLPSLETAVAGGPAASIVVVDNRSTAGDVAWIAAHHPAVEVIVAERNDYLFSLNPVVAKRPEEVVVILNNDMRVDPGFLGPLLTHFTDPSVFAATARVLDWDGTRQTTGQRRIALRHCWYYQWWELSVSGPVHTLDAGGGCAAFRRRYFAELGGFDPLFRPAYYEDIDLSYRAWMRGWRTVFEPRSVIYHRVGATLWDPARDARHRAMLARNQALFTMKNVGGWGFLAGYLAMAPVRAVRSALHGDPYTARGLARAVPRAARAIAARARRPRPVLSAESIRLAIEAGIPS
jgi:GT2 family glycosyltransferase